MIQIKHILELCLKIYFFLNTFFEKRNEDSYDFYNYFDAHIEVHSACKPKTIIAFVESHVVT